ncbi:pseudouridine synthase [Paraflavisolibacter sp. H34]|uniref:pseudouridine synthase n=1 Tax=Huijunlia imazamoxiresistens TaxID=3127457 RepID=UPI003016FF13
MRSRLNEASRRTAHYRYFTVYKPYMMLCQFTAEQAGDVTLKDLDYPFPPDVYPVGRLDKDSEGLLLLTNDNQLKTKYLKPQTETPKTYYAQLEGEISPQAVGQLSKGVTINVGGSAYTTLPARVRRIDPPGHLPERNPPIRYRKEKPTSWIEITIVEGKNRQIRKMTAQVGFPTLRLVRVAIGTLKLTRLAPGQVEEVGKPWNL